MLGVDGEEQACSRETMTTILACFVLILVQPFRVAILLPTVLASVIILFLWYVAKIVLYFLVLDNNKPQVIGRTAKLGLCQIPSRPLFA